MSTNKFWGKVMFCNMFLILFTGGMCLAKLSTGGLHFPPKVKAPSSIFQEEDLSELTPLSPQVVNP